MPDVIVVGGGISGLACGVRLLAAGVDVRVIEERDEPGGNVRTLAEAGYRMERGPHTFMASAEDVFALASEVGAEPDLVQAREASAVRYIARAGRLHRVFTGPVEFARSDLLSWKGKLDLVTEPFRTSRGEEGDTAATFFERRFGPEAARVLAGSFVSGVYAGDPAILSAPAAFPLFWGFEKESGGMIRGAVRHMLRRRRERRAMGPAAPPSRRGLWSLSGGLGTLGRAASTVLGERLITDRGIGRIVREDGQWDVDGERAPVLVLAVPPGRAADLLEPLDGRMAGAARDIVMAPIVGVHLGFSSRVAEVPDAFGFLVPRGEGIRTLGVLFPSRMFRDRVPAGGDLLTGFVGGVLDPRALELSDADLVETVLGDLAALVGVERRPDHVHVMRYPAAIPQLTLGHAERMQELRRGLERLRGLLLAGNWQRGVGIKDAVGSGMDAARAALAELAG